MDTHGWGLIFLGGLMLLCIVIIIIASLYLVWLIRFAHSVLNKKPIPAPPFSKSKTE